MCGGWLRAEIAAVRGGVVGCDVVQTRLWCRQPPEVARVAERGAGQNSQKSVLE